MAMEKYAWSFKPEKFSVLYKLALFSSIKEIIDYVLDNKCIIYILGKIRQSIESA